MGKQIVIVIALMLLAVPAAYSFDFTSGGSANATKSKKIGDITCTAKFFNMGISEGEVTAATFTQQTGLDILVPSDQSGAVLKQGDIWAKWSEPTAVGPYDVTHTIRSGAFGSATSHANPVGQSLYLGSFDNRVIAATRVSSEGLTNLDIEPIWEHRVDLEDNDSHDYGEDWALGSFTETVEIESDENGFFVKISLTVQALTSYAGFNQPPTSTNPQHGVTGNIGAAYKINLLEPVAK